MWGVLRQKRHKGSGTPRERWAVNVVLGTRWRGGWRSVGFQFSCCTYTRLSPQSHWSCRNTSLEWVTPWEIRENEPSPDRPGPDRAESRGQWQWSKEPKVTKALKNSQKSLESHWISYKTWNKGSKPILFQPQTTVGPQLTSGYIVAPTRDISTASTTLRVTCFMPAFPAD